jgi:hypothetical protein
MPAKITNNLDRFISKQERKMIRTMQKILIVGGSHASLFTPIDTSTLLNSAYRKVDVTHGVIKGTYGYTANYAKYVHDPNISQKFILATAKKEFLRIGFEEAKPLIDAIVKKDLAV